FTQNILFFDLMILLMMFYGWMLLDRDKKSPWYMGDVWPLRRFLTWAHAHMSDSKVTGPPKDKSKEFAGDKAPTPKLLPGLMSVLTFVLLFCWLFGIEFFPFTAMQMYSKKRDTGRVEYYRVLAERSDGSLERAYIEHAIPALRDGRFRQALRLCFQPDERANCEALMRAAGPRLEHPESIVAIQVQHREWDFRENLSDPEHGETLASIRVPL
ncbi:MAG: hypothetical protein AAF550_07570, partial [Myxococcota bacterium]